jgi:hypothetical protein
MTHPESTTEYERAIIEEYEENADARAVWDTEVSACAACSAMPEDEVCSDHDLDDPVVARRYGMGR